MRSSAISIGLLPSAVLIITTNEPDTVRFTVEYLGSSDTGEVRRGQTTSVSLPIGRVGEIGDIRVQNENERNKGIHIKAEGTKQLTVFGVNTADVSTDAFLALPCHQYPVKAYRYFVFSADVVGTSIAFESQFLIVGCEDSTLVTVKPTRTIVIPSDVISGQVRQIVDPYSCDESVNTGSFVVHRLQTILFSSRNDLTGTIIESDKPISVFVGHECANIPSDHRYCDYLVEQIPPDATWGTQFFTVPLNIRESGERYRVGTVADDNEVIVTCTTEGLIPRLVIRETIQLQHLGQRFIEFDTLGDNRDGINADYKRDFCCIETSKPAIAMMYSKGAKVDKITIPTRVGFQGDPFMLLVPPVSQYLDEYTVTPVHSVAGEFISHISYALPIQFFNNSVESRTAFMINGSTFTPDSGYQTIYCSNGQMCGYGAYSGIPSGDRLLQYNVLASTMSMYVYGFLRENSFAYPAGFEMKAIAGIF